VVYSRKSSFYFSWARLDRAMQRPVRSRNLYSVRRVFDGRKVVVDGQSAARAMSAPFMLNQTRVRHERKHLLHDVSRHAPHWAHSFQAVGLYRARATIHGPRSPSHVPHRTRRRYASRSRARRMQVPKREPARNNRTHRTSPARFETSLAFRNVLRRAASIRLHPRRLFGADRNAALAYSRSHLPTHPI
jgi:hypothetical protein